MFFLVATTSIGSTASKDRVKVGCKDLAFVLITWDQLLPLVPEDDIAENEHQLNENGVEPDTYQDIIDRHINDLLKDINKCDLNDAVEQMVEDIDPELPVFQNLLTCRESTYSGKCGSTISSLSSSTFGD